jgi:hypothetical protein
MPKETSVTQDSEEKFRVFERIVNLIAYAAFLLHIYFHSFDLFIEKPNTSFQNSNEAIQSLQKAIKDAESRFNDNKLLLNKLSLSLEDSIETYFSITPGTYTSGGPPECPYFIKIEFKTELYFFRTTKELLAGSIEVLVKEKNISCLQTDTVTANYVFDMTGSVRNKNRYNIEFESRETLYPNYSLSFAGVLDTSNKKFEAFWTMYRNSKDGPQNINISSFSSNSELYTQ